jgi:hypothetical protein
MRMLKSIIRLRHIFLNQMNIPLVKLMRATGSLKTTLLALFDVTSPGSMFVNGAVFLAHHEQCVQTDCQQVEGSEMGDYWKRH